MRPAAGGDKRAYKQASVLLPRIAGWVLFLCLLFVLLWIFLLPATNPRLLRLLMDEPAKLDRQWITQDMAGLSDSIGGYLSSAIPSPQSEIHTSGITVPAFQEHELLHLMDVRNLFSLAFHLGRAGLLILIAVSIILLTAGTSRFSARLGNLAGAWQAAVLGVLGILALLGILASTRFDQAFFSMHKLLFSNDLWLLNPQTDVLIQLMPRRFLWSMRGMP